MKVWGSVLKFYEIALNMSLVVDRKEVAAAKLIVYIYL